MKDKAKAIPDGRGKSKKVSSAVEVEASASKVDDAKAATNVKVVNFNTLKKPGFQYNLYP